MDIYQFLFEKSPSAILILDHQGRIQKQNRKFSQLSGFNDSELDNKLISNISPVVWQDILDATNSDQLIEIVFPRREGQQLRLQVQILSEKSATKQANYVLVCQDVTNKHALMSKNDVTKQQLETLFENSSDAIAYFNMAGHCERANSAFCNLIGYQLHEIQQLNYSDYTPPGWLEVDRQITEQISKTTSTELFEKEYIHKNGQTISISLRATGIRNIDNQVIGAWFIVRDVSDNQQHVRALKHQQQLLEQIGRLAGVGGWEYQESSRQVKFTPEALKLLGLPLNYNGDLFNTLKLFAEESRYELQACVEVAFMLKTPFDLEAEYLGFKQRRWIKLTGRVKTDGNQQYIIGALQDISSFRKTSKVTSSSGIENSKTESRVFLDVLTKLPNQLFLNDRLKKALEHRKRYRNPLVFMELDLQQFRRINENAGYSAGDACLVQLALRLSHLLRKEDMLARIGGDEFAIVAENCPKNRASELATQLLESIEQVIEIDNQKFQLKAVISVILIENDLSIVDIYRAAENGIEQLKNEENQLKITQL